MNRKMSLVLILFSVNTVIVLIIGTVLGRELTRQNWFTDFDCKDIAFFYSDYLVKTYDLTYSPKETANDAKRREIDNKEAELEDALWKICNTNPTL